MTDESVPAVPAPRHGPAGNGGGRRRRVVVGVDGSPGSRAALRYAMAAAAARDADLDVESAVPVQLYWSGPYAVSPTVLDDVQRDTGTRIRSLVEEVRRETGSDLPDERVHVFTTGGGAAQALLERAEGADLLVVGNRGRGAVRSALLGSVALHCVAAASCPVVVVHDRAAEPDGADPGDGAVVVGVDGSPAAAAALAVAAEEAARWGVRLDVVAAYRLADYWTDMYDVLIPSAEEIVADVHSRAEAMVGQMTGTVAVLPPEVRTVVAEGVPADVLLERARGARLLVVGGSGHGAIRSLLLGSVALQCALHAPCAVEVVHARDRAATAEPAAAGSGALTGG